MRAETKLSLIPTLIIEADKHGAIEEPNLYGQKASTFALASSLFFFVLMFAFSYNAVPESLFLSLHLL